jgi:hypothetical protein
MLILLIFSLKQIATFSLTLKITSISNKIIHPAKVFVEYGNTTKTDRLYRIIFII